MALRLYAILSDLGAASRGAALGPSAILYHDSMHERVFSAHIPRVLGGSYGPCYAEEEAGSSMRHISSITALNGEISRVISSSLGSDDKAIFLSGDHSSAIGIISGLSCVHARIGVVWVDAHADMNNPYSTPSGNIHGMSLGALLGTQRWGKKEERGAGVQALWRGLTHIGSRQRYCLSSSDVCMIGLRSVDAFEQEFIESHGIACISVEEVSRWGISGVIEKVGSVLSHCTHIMVSFDIDSMDKSHVLGTGTPVAGGFSPSVALSLNTALCGMPKVFAWELTEYNPLLDDVSKTLSLSYAQGKAAIKALG